MTFVDWIAARIGTRNWFVGRWSSKTRDKYDARITPKEYRRLKAEWETRK